MHELTIENTYLTSFIFSFATDISADIYTITTEDIVTGNITVTTGTTSPIIVTDLTVGNAYVFSLTNSVNNIPHPPLQVVLNPKVYVNPYTIFLYPLYNYGGIGGVYTPNVASGYYVYDASFQNNVTIVDRSIFKSLFIPDQTSYLSLPPFETTNVEQTIAWCSKSDISFSFVDISNNTLHAYTTDVSNQIILKMNDFQQTIDISVNVNDWHYYTWVLTENQWRVYVDETEYDISGQIPWVTTYIDNKLGTNSVNAYCKDFRMFDYAITKENAITLYLHLGLMIYYTFESYSFNNTYLNFVSNNYDMVFIGDSYITDLPPHEGRCLKINKIESTPSYIYSVFSNKVYITAESGFSFMGWYYFLDNPGPTNPMFIVNSANYDASGNVISYKNINGIGCMDITGDGKANLYYYSGSNKVFQDTSIQLPLEAYTPGMWTHYVLTVSTTNVWSVYINGSLCGSVVDNSSNFYDTYNIDNPFSIVTIGAQNDLLIETPNCYYDDMRIYNRVLSVKDIIELLNVENNVLLPSSDLGLWLDAVSFLTYLYPIYIWNAKNGSNNSVIATDCSYGFTTPASIKISASTGKLSYPFYINDLSGSTLFFVFSISDIPTVNQSYSLLSVGENSNSGVDIRISAVNGLEIGYSIKNTEVVVDISFTPYYYSSWPDLQTNTTYMLTIQTDPFLIRINGSTITPTEVFASGLPIQNYDTTKFYTNTNIFGPGNPADMNVNEFLYYHQTISKNMYVQIEGYLAWKWNLQTYLPIDHPFLTAPVKYINATFP